MKLVCLPNWFVLPNFTVDGDRRYSALSFPHYAQRCHQLRRSTKVPHGWIRTSLGQWFTRSQPSRQVSLLLWSPWLIMNSWLTRKSKWTFCLHCRNCGRPRKLRVLANSWYQWPANDLLSTTGNVLVDRYHALISPYKLVVQSASCQKVLNYNNTPKTMHNFMSDKCSFYCARS